MSIFWFFNKSLNKDYLKLAQIVYGGDFYTELKKYQLKEVSIKNSRIKKYTDSLLSKKGNEDFFSYKNQDSGFTACLFENIKTKELVIAYRGTERCGLGENETDIASIMKDVSTDVSLLSGTYDEHFKDAWEFYITVKKENPRKKIIIVGQSLGGAIAQIISAKEYTIHRQKIKTFTYNAPGCRHLLDLYGCNTEFDYSFITNYSVMNDWCGMFGDHIGSRFFIKPIPMKNVDSNSATEVINNVMLTTHEGIFKYTKEKMGEIIKKPADFNQLEGLSLWYFDKNNPMKDFKNFSDFISANFPQLKFLLQDNNNDFMHKTEQFFKENLPEEIQNSGIAVAIKNAADSITQAQNESINKWMNENAIGIVIKTLDSVFSEISEESYERAKNILKRLKIDN